MLDDKFNELDQYIKNVDFFVDIDKVKDTVQPETDKVLKGL
jgi:predicted Ser/Thr protein kinase